jgi:hypothetical protein
MHISKKPEYSCSYKMQDFQAKLEAKLGKLEQHVRAQLIFGWCAVNGWRRYRLCFKKGHKNTLAPRIILYSETNYR